MSDNPLDSFYALTPQRLAEMREQFPLHAPWIDELGTLVPYIKRMADESNVRKLTTEERNEMMRVAQRMADIALALVENPHPTKQ